MRTDRRYGLVLDGTVLTSAVTQGGRVVATGTLTAANNEEALEAWWVRTRPRGPVTAAVVSDTTHVATIEVGGDVPPGLVRRHVESKVRSLGAGEPVAFAVAARLTDEDGTVPVAAVPAEVMERLWHSGHAAIRYTVPAMAYTLGGVHLLVSHSASELVLVDGIGRRPVDSVVLASGGIAPGADPIDRRAHADAVADEVDRAIESWRRRGHVINGDEVQVTGTGVAGDELFDAISLRGYRPRLDRVTEQFGADAWRAAGADDRVALLRCALAAAVAVCEPGPLGFLEPPGPRGSTAPTPRATRWMQRFGGRVAGKRSWRPVALAIAVWLMGLAGVALVANAVPAALGGRTVAAATQRHQQAEIVASRLGPDIALYRHEAWMSAQAARLVGTGWSTLVPAVDATMPPGITVQSLDLTDGATSVAVKVTAAAASPALVPEWLARLQQAGIDASTPSVTVDRSGAATFTTTFDVPRKF